MFGRGPDTNQFPRMSRARLKVVDSESSEIGDGTTTAPTAEERQWFDLLKSTAPEMEKLRKKLAVCAVAEVVDYDPSKVTVSYDGVNYTINKPNNSLRIARAREHSIIAAFEELNAQRCVVIGAVPIAKDFSGIDAEVIKLLSDVAENFFFTPYL
jgi:hypothetical protein